MIFIQFVELFFVGIIECFLSALHTKFLQKSKKLFCFIVSFLNILIWWYVLRIMVENLTNIYMIIVYGIGYASGNICALLFDGYLDKLAKIKGFKIKKRKRKLRLKK